MCQMCDQSPDYGDTPRRCGFQGIHPAGIPVFHPDNWNCGTLNAIKRYAEQYGRIATSLECGRVWALSYPPAGGWVILTGAPTGGRVDNAVYLEDDHCYLLPVAMAEKIVKYYKVRAISGDCEVLA